MKKVLLIEDNKDVRENTSEILELAGYKVFAAKNGKDGVETALREMPDLIICDIMMPILDGYGVLHMLSKNETTSGIPFIFLTAKAERSEMRKGMEMGADDYLTKPFDEIELLNAIEVRLRKADFLKKEFSKSAEGINEFINDARSIEDLKKISTIRDSRSYKKKESIYKEDGVPRGIYFLNKGKVKSSRSHETGKEFITGLYKDGDFFGYLALMEDRSYSDTAEAIEDSDISFIPKEDFIDLLYKNAEVSRKFIQLLSDNLVEKEEQLVKLAYNSVRKRVSEALITLNNRYKSADDKQFAMKISREDIARLAGTATETTIRTLSDFKSEGLIDINGRTIIILNAEKLEKMKN
ncbi:MAG: response regulator [Bacteroidia bacterium]|jgi:CRP-like cAMP-binding protein